MTKMDNHQPEKGARRPWMIPALVVVGTIVLGVLIAIRQYLSGSDIPSKPLIREAISTIGIIVIITVAVPTLAAVWFLVKRWSEQNQAWFRHWRNRNKHKVLPK